MTDERFIELREKISRFALVPSRDLAEALDEIQILSASLGSANKALQVLLETVRGLRTLIRR